MKLNKIWREGRTINALCGGKIYQLNYTDKENLLLAVFTDSFEGWKTDNYSPDRHPVGQELLKILMSEKLGI